MKSKTDETITTHNFIGGIILKIAVIGYSGNIDLPPVKPLTEICEHLGSRIAECGHTMVNGGTDGVMELVSRGALKSGGTVIGMLSDNETPNNYLSTAINTGFDFSVRSIMMMYNADAVISVGGKVGTGLELFAAYVQSKPIILLRGTGGWTDRITSVLLEGKYLDERRSVELKSAWSVDEAVDIVELSVGGANSTKNV